MCPANSIDGIQRGYVIPIGGGEEKFEQPAVLKRFAELCSRGHIAIIPTASKLPDSGPRYIEVFKELGVRNLSNLPILERADCEREDYLNILKEVDGIFITGGNQLRLSTIMGGTTIAKTIRRLNAQGVHVAGTSAGAAIMSEHMIIGGEGGSTPTADGVTLAPGLGLTNNVIIDQHFRQRDRLGRLLTAVSYNPFVSGIGLDEDTAAFINPEGEFEVVGSGAVTIVDPSQLEFSSMAEARRDEAITLIGMRLHVLSEGARYDTNQRIARPS